MQQGIVSKPENINWATHGFYEYLLVTHPSKAICNTIIEEQQQFFIDYGIKKVSRMMPHITVANFLAREGMEETLIRWIQRICGTQPAFDVTLNNYSGIPPYSIHVRVQDTFPFQQLAQRLKPIDDFIRSSSCPPVKMAKPRINIATRLPEQVYLKAMPDYSEKTFHGKFMAQELLLLKRAHPFEACKTVNVFRFLPVESNVYSEVA
jgi:2'-5' RNA ligase